MIESNPLRSIKLQTIANTKRFPKEGELLEVRGGLGNTILKQLKNEKGIIYERKNSNDKWKKFNMSKLFD